MRKQLMLKSKSVLIALACSLTLMAYAFADDLKKIDVPPGELGAALRLLAKQAGVEFFYRSEQVNGLHTKGVSGTLSPQEAVTKLLEGTALTVRMDATGAMLIAPPPPSAPTSIKPPHADSQIPSAGEKQNDSPQSRLQLAQAGEGTPATSSDRSASQQGSSQLQEIVVTAQKKEERLQDVPVPVTSVAAQTLADSNLVRFQDYFSRIPGVSMSVSTQGAPNVAIRGIATYAANPTVAFVVDDVPYGASSYLGGGGVVPEINPSELARVEVLRGPQGTLYGASSIGGLIKYVTVDPSTERFSGSVQAGLNEVHNSDVPGHNVSGSVNVPLNDTWAIRASGFQRRDAGYIDNVTAGSKGVNQADAYGGRVSAMWKPSESLSLKLGAQLQNYDRDGVPRVDPALGDLQQGTLQRTGSYHRKSQVYSATLKADIGSGSFTSVSGYSIDEFSDVLDLSSIYRVLTQLLFSVPGAPEFEHNETKKFTQEMRYSIPLGSRVEWLVGAYYSNEDSLWTQDVQAANGNTGAPLASAIFNTQGPMTFKEYSAFTDLTFHFTDRFDVQLGGRESHNKQTYENTFSGPFVPILFPGTTSPLQTNVQTHENSFTYLVTPRFRVSDDLMLYARLASGYRPGGPNFLAEPRGLPLSFKPDKTKNYEIGAKGALLDRLLSFDASTYYITWKDFQTQISLPQGGYTANGSAAKSEGVELSLESKPLNGLTLATWLAWNEAVMTGSMPPGSAVYGVPGNRLPFTGRWTGNFSVEQEFPINGSATGFVGGTASYVGDRLERFRGLAAGVPLPRQKLPSYTQVDLRVGARFDTWTLNVYGNNVTDKRGVLQGGLGTVFPNCFYYIQPRTIGIGVDRRF